MSRAPPFPLQVDARLGCLRPAAALALLALVAALGAGCGEHAPGAASAPSASHRALIEFGGRTMGTTYTVKVAGESRDEAGHAALREAVRAALDAVDAKMSTWKPDSEVSRLNRHADPTPFALSADTVRVLLMAREVSAASEGAFDVTVGPLVDAWGFGPRKREGMPSEPEIRALRARVGWRMLGIDAQALAVTKARADLQVDLSAIAKGFGVDEAGRALEALGVAHYMVEVGGEVRARGLNRDGEPWRIGIERPEDGPQRAYLVVPLSGRSMATSGDYRNYFEKDGRRYSHEIDPSTGAPITHRLASVTVVDGECAMADAWATALIVMGPERGWTLANARGLAAHFIVRREDGRFVERATPAFAALGAQPGERR